MATSTDTIDATSDRSISMQQDAPYREVTVASVVLGITLGCLMNAAFVYIGLKYGFGLAGSTVAAILGFALLRGVGRGVLKVPGAGSIVENNINQTIASGVNTASSGVVFTLPALLLMGADFNVWTVILATTAGSFMGIVIIIPLRKQMIEIERLRFPTGVAVANILRSPGEGSAKAVRLAIGFAIGGVITYATKSHWLPEDLPVGGFISDLLGLNASGPAGFALHATQLGMTTAMIGAGMLVGRDGLPMVLGAGAAWWLVAPVGISQGWAGQTTGGAQWGAVYGTMLRPVGIGILIGGALASVVASYPAIRGALRSLAAAAAAAKSSDGEAAEELSIRTLVSGLIASFVVLFVVCMLGSGGQPPGIGTATLVAFAGTLWLALAGMIVAQATGATDISPLSGLALIAVTLMLALTGGHVVLGVTIGVAVCVATNQCADMMADLKTGHLVGSVPRRQQLTQFAVAWIGPALSIGVVLLLWKAGPGGTGGFGPESAGCAEGGAGGCLPAPQAAVLSNMVQTVLSGDVPLDKYAAGAAIGAAVTMMPSPGMGVLIGLAMYLPFSVTLAYGFGCVINMLVSRIKGQQTVTGTLIPLAAGLIVGEALIALTLTLKDLAGGV